MIDNSERINKMRHLLNTALNPSQLEIIDDSHLHIGHAGAQGGAGHFTVIITSEAFHGKRQVACHRLIYEALDSMLPKDIHALSIKIQKN